MTGSGRLGRLGSISIGFYGQNSLKGSTGDDVIHNQSCSISEIDGSDIYFKNEL